MYLKFLQASAVAAPSASAAPRTTDVKEELVDVDVKKEKAARDRKTKVSLMSFERFRKTFKELQYAQYLAALDANAKRKSITINKASLTRFDDIGIIPWMISGDSYGRSFNWQLPCLMAKGCFIFNGVLHPATLASWKKLNWYSTKEELSEARGLVEFGEGVDALLKSVHDTFSSLRPKNEEAANFKDMLGLVQVAVWKNVTLATFCKYKNTKQLTAANLKLLAVKKEVKKEVEDNNSSKRTSKEPDVQDEKANSNYSPRKKKAKNE